MANITDPLQFYDAPLGRAAVAPLCVNQQLFDFTVMAQPKSAHRPEGKDVQPPLHQAMGIA